RFAVAVWDEEAKVNVNTLYDRGDALKTQSTVRELVRAAGAGGGDVAVRLQPLYGPGRARMRGAQPQKPGRAVPASRPATGQVVSVTAIPPAFETLGQVFGSTPAARWAGLPSGPAIAGELTCWGSGK